MRRRLSMVIEAFGVDGTLVVPKYGPWPEGGEPPPGDALKWPPCRCGSRICPDFEPADVATEPGPGGAT
ncbi:hypothetical protein [Streptomyces sp. NBC_01429]|uniref:hypothetical protein n=1 Tax=Streptomyces sp. NBC_01429 TaxID=2903862 RepID=UPI002E285939|nr:hypothetical protein [Streptomyces sp. NBC_01429]